MLLRLRDLHPQLCQGWACWHSHQRLWGSLACAAQCGTLDLPLCCSRHPPPIHSSLLSQCSNQQQKKRFRTGFVVFDLISEITTLSQNWRIVITKVSVLPWHSSTLKSSRDHTAPVTQGWQSHPSEIPSPKFTPDVYFCCLATRGISWYGE